MAGTATSNMVWIPGGAFQMGSADFYIEERPVHTVSVDGFWIDAAPVINKDYARFVDETGYVTVAEHDLNADDYPGIRPENIAAGSLVFTQSAGPVDLGNPGNWWRFIKGAHWRVPDGENSNQDLGQHPVVQMAYEDAEAYASWIGKSLPTEAEWEYAARGGVDGATFPWGDEPYPDGRVMANTWEGDFPWKNTDNNGYIRTSPVGAYPPNDYGLVDMVGNVWEWTQDWWSSTHQFLNEAACCAPGNRRGGAMQNSYDPDQPGVNIPRKVLKGGSHLCAPNYCLRYRPAARIPQMIESATSHIGFRCMVRTD